MTHIEFAPALVDEHGDIGPAVRVEVEGNAGGLFSAGGEAHDADACGVDAPFPGVGANHFDGLRSIRAVRAPSIAQDEHRHANAAQPFRDIRTLPCLQIVDVNHLLNTAGMPLVGVNTSG